MPASALSFVMQSLDTRSFLLAVLTVLAAFTAHENDKTRCNEPGRMLTACMTGGRLPAG